MTEYTGLSLEDLARAVAQLRYEASPEGQAEQAKRMDDFNKWVEDRMAGKPLPMIPTK